MSGSEACTVWRHDKMNLRSKLLLDYYFGGFLHASLRIPTILLGKLLRRDHDLSKCREIAILKLLGGGSLVIAYPALLALRRLPGLEKLTLITTPAIAPFGELLGIFDEIVIVRDDRGLLTLAADSLRVCRRLFGHDALIDLEIHSRLTTVFALLTAARNRIGFFTNISFWRRRLNTHLLFCNITNGIYDFYDQLGALFGTSAVDAAACERELRSRLGGYGFEEDLFRLAIAPVRSEVGGERIARREEWAEAVAPRIALGESTVELHASTAPSHGADLGRITTVMAGPVRSRVTVPNHARKTSLMELAPLLETSPVDGGECEREFRSRLGEYGFEGKVFRLAIAPTCSGLSRERMLRREEWVEVVAPRIARCEPGVVEVHLLGAAADRAELEQIANLLERRFRGRVTIRNHAGRTSLKESVRIIAAMDEVYCIDSALLHFSRLLGRQTVSFWGPTDPRTLIRPNPRGLDEIHYLKIPCSPCVHMSHQPPCKGQNICMRLAVDPAAPVPHNQPWVLKG